MSDNLSPWIAQLKNHRVLKPLLQNTQAEVAIVGAGIAGVTTAYFTLKNTSKKVLLIESGKAAHGATGHNAGQIVSYFERPTSELVEEFGFEKTAKAQQEIDTAWDILEEIYADTKLQTPFDLFTGFAGFQNITQILTHLEKIQYCLEAKINYEALVIAEDAEIIKEIPPHFTGLYTTLPHQGILSMLETEDERYIAALSAKKGCMNSALFCEDLITFMLSNYSHRFELVENTPVQEVYLEKKQARLKIKDLEVVAEKVVLCTNGFERFSIINSIGLDINQSFHHLVQGSVGYMAAYLEPNTQEPVAISYLPSASKTGNQAFDTLPYFYLTRRAFEMEPAQKHSLICIGGPETVMDDTNNYVQAHPYPEEAQAVIDTFLDQTFKYAPKQPIKYLYRWHGLMGYTPNGVRCVGPEPLNPVLLYNLGCNGIGILPSIYGAKRVSRYLRGDVLEKTIFDPRNSSRYLKMKQALSTLFTA